MSDDELGDLDWLTWEWIVELAQSGNSPKNGWHLWVSGSSQKIGKTPVCYWCGKRKDQEVEA